MVENEPIMLCTNEEPEFFFPHGEDKSHRKHPNRDMIEEAKAICMRCVSRIECLDGALQREEEHGIWGGMTTFERKTLLNRARRAS